MGICNADAEGFVLGLPVTVMVLAAVSVGSAVLPIIICGEVDTTESSAEA